MPLNNQLELPQTPKPMTATEARLRAMAEAMGISHHQLANPIFHNYVSNRSGVSPLSPTSEPPVEQLPQEGVLIKAVLQLQEKNPVNPFQLIKEQDYAKQEFQRNVDAMKKGEGFPYDGSTLPPAEAKKPPQPKRKFDPNETYSDMIHKSLENIRKLGVPIPHYSDLVKEAVVQKNPDQKTGPRIKGSEPGTKCSNPVPTRELNDDVQEGAPDQPPIIGLTPQVVGGPSQPPKVGPAAESGGNKKKKKICNKENVELMDVVVAILSEKRNLNAIFRK